MSTQIQPVTQSPTVPDAAKSDLVRRAENFERACASFVCESEEDFKMLSLLVNQSAKLVDDAKATYDERIATAHKLHKDLCADRAAITGPAETGRKLLNGKGLAWQRKVQAEIDEANRRAIEAAEAQNRRDAEERRRIAEEAERERQAAIQRDQEAARKQGATEAEVAAIERHAPPVEIPAMPAPAVPALVQAPVVKGGPTMRKNFQARVDDPVKFWASVTAPPQLLRVLQDKAVVEAIGKALTKEAKDLELALKIPGVYVWDEGTLARGRK